MRLDKWLWSARFYKTRALAAEEAGRGHVTVNGQLAKPGREIKATDRVAMRYTAFNVSLSRDVTVLALAATRGPASVAQGLYAETQDSKNARDKAFAERALHTEPAHSITGGRPSKRDRRELSELQDGKARPWDARWSASAD